MLLSHNGDGALFGIDAIPQQSEEFAPRASQVRVSRGRIPIAFDLSMKRRK